RAVETSSYCLQEKYKSIAYEVRINTRESDGHWYHRCLTESNHHLWRNQKQRIHRRNIYPCAPVDYTNVQGHGILGPTKVFSGPYDPQYVDIRLFNLQYVGWVPNIRAEFYREVVARQKLSKLKLPGLSEYLGCVVENGLIVGIAISKSPCSLEQALNQDMPCTEMHSKDLVDTVAVMQRLSLIKSPIYPSAVGLDRYNRMTLESIECMFDSDWHGGTKPMRADVMHDDDASTLARNNALAPVFSRLCSKTKEFGHKRYSVGAYDIYNACNRGTCKHDYLHAPILATRPQNHHTLHVAAPQPPAVLTFTNVAIVSCIAAAAVAQTAGQTAYYPSISPVSNVDTHLARLMSSYDLSHVSSVDTTTPVLTSDVFDPSTGKFMPMSMPVMQTSSGGYYMPVCSVDTLNSGTAPENCQFGVPMMQLPANAARTYASVGGHLVQAIRSAANPMFQVSGMNVPSTGLATRSGPSANEWTRDRDFNDQQQQQEQQQGNGGQQQQQQQQQEDRFRFRW
ncbi:hypothetical protein GGI05_005290, partial [Coemansia sp. RSA 2603]